MFAISDKLPGSNLCVVVHDANMLNRCQVKGVINQQENQRSMHGADRLIVHTHTLTLSYQSNAINGNNEIEISFQSSTMGRGVLQHLQ